MVTIRFTRPSDKEQLEKAHRIIVLNGPVEYTPYKWTYKVPNWILELLKKENIPYEEVKNGHR